MAIMYNNKYSSTTTCIIILFVIIAAMSTRSVGVQGQITVGALANVVELQINGILYCSPDGNNQGGGGGGGGGGGEGVDNVLVGLLCNNATSNTNTLTDSAGNFSFLLSILPGPEFDPSQCLVAVTLPAGNCALLPTTGVLQAPLTLLGIITNALGVNVANLGIGQWIALI